MIDIHSHILFGIDDGAKSMQESVQMAREAQKAGFTDIICTPHHRKNAIDGVTEEQQEKCMKRLQEELDKDHIAIQLHKGNEIYVDETLKDSYCTKKLTTLASTKYLLIELPMNVEYKYLENLIYEIKELGLIPIIAHPERYTYIQEDPNKLVNIIELGVLLQSNLASIIGRYGKEAEKTIKTLLKSNVIQFLATDIHREGSIYTEIQKIYAKLEKIVGKEKAEELCKDNPEKLLKDEKVYINKVKKIKKSMF